MSSLLQVLGKANLHLHTQQKQISYSPLLTVPLSSHPYPWRLSAFEMPPQVAGIVSPPIATHTSGDPGTVIIRLIDICPVLFKVAYTYPPGN